MDAVLNDGLEDCLILKNPRNYQSRASLWRAQKLGAPTQLEPVDHKSWPYHSGLSTLAPLMFSEIGIGAKESEEERFRGETRPDRPTRRDGVLLDPRRHRKVDQPDKRKLLKRIILSPQTHRSALG